MTALDRPHAEEHASRSMGPPPSFETRPAGAPPDEGGGTPKSFWAQHEHALLGTISMLVFLSFWEMSVAFGWVNPLFTSSPSRIVHTAIEMFADGSILTDIEVSGYEFIVGYGAAIVIGVPLGILMGWYGRVDAVLDPFVSALYATPRIALLPLVMIWFGIGLMSKIAIVFLGAIFPILVNTITGVRTVNADFVKVARSFGSNDWQMFLTVALPSSVPLLLTGLRLGLGHALVGIVVGEMYGATHGLGFLIATAGARFQTDKVMVGIIIIASAGIAMTELLRLIERRFDRWRPSVGN
jgi:ABC-type nitrate/sulfonate/bicarbonate transport system permease component